MKIKLKPDQEIAVQKIWIGRVPTLILRPAHRSSVPVSILWIHGGGYITGMKQMVYMSRAADLVKKYGVTVYSPGYRLAWQKPYPAAMNDCYQVLEYMSRQPEPIMVGGESAGGGLAVAVCMMNKGQGNQSRFSDAPVSHDQQHRHRKLQGQPWQGVEHEKESFRMAAVSAEERQENRIALCRPGTSNELHPSAALLHLCRRWRTILR